eukprot:7881589-Prorocentrum_lima.AAC.1
MAHLLQLGVSEAVSPVPVPRWEPQNGLPCTVGKFVLLLPSSMLANPGPGSFGDGLAEGLVACSVLVYGAEYCL